MNPHRIVVGAAPVSAVAALLLAATPCSVVAQGGALVQGILDGEMWSTNTSSNFLTRNDGHPGGFGRLELWGAVEPWRGVYLYAAGHAQGGPARADTTAPFSALEQLGVRVQHSPRLLVDIGKMPSPLGAFAPRRFSDRNPLIGMPDGYPVQYPVGATASGVLGRFDYRLGVVSIGAYHQGYVPKPDDAAHPVVGAGITPVVGLRIGVSGITGPYLNKDFSVSQLANQDWTSYHERIGAVDAQFSRGYLELRGEWARNSYDVPNAADPVRGTTYYVEGKFTVTPRFFVAARHERNNYPFIAAFGDTWVGTDTDFDNTEAGVGFRATATTIIKASYRTDKWVVTPANEAFIRPGGHAIALQISQSFDVMDLITRQR